MNCSRCGVKLLDGSLYCHACGKKQTVQEKRKALKRANGTGTVYKLQGRRKRPWVASRNKVILGYYETKTAALDVLNSLARKSIDERYNMTFSEVYEAWKTEHFRDIGVKGVESYENAYRIFAPLHDKKFRELRTVDFQSIIDKYLNRSYSTLSKYKQLITQMSDWAIREELISTNFASFVKLPENVKREKPTFSKEEIAKFKADNSETAKIILMLIYTGMRIGELFSLPLEDYHGKYVVGGKKTDAGRNRIIPIWPDGREYFEYFAQRATGDMLLSGYSGQRNADNFRNRDYFPLLKKLGIEKKPPHTTRHTNSSMAVAAKMRPELLQKILGHADYSTTANIYVHSDIEELINAVENC